MDEVKEKATEVYGRNKLLKKFAAYDVLILDEWLMADLKKDDVAFLFELSERRFDRASTIFCTLYKAEEWIPRLGKGTFAESIDERFAAHDAIVIDTGEMNMREIRTKRLLLRPFRSWLLCLDHQHRHLCHKNIVPIVTIETIKI